MEPYRDVPRQPCILIVDDDPQGLRLLHTILAGLAKIVFAKTGEEALDQVTQCQPDLILLDAEMPGLGGYATCRALKSDTETADIPIVFVTSHTDTGSETRALELGAADFIQKPVNPAVVLARVKTQLSLKQKTDALRRLTHLDALTGVANRRAFDEALEIETRRSLRTGEPLSLLMLDVDFFKRYNDTYGHPAGDVCLRQIAQIMAQTAKRAGDLVARYGGEEFAIILPHTRAADARVFAERLCGLIRDQAILHRESTAASVVTLSIGVASLDPSCNEADSGTSAHSPGASPGRRVYSPESLLALADRALYQAKQQGRNQVRSLSSLPDEDMPDNILPASPPTQPSS